MSSDFKGLEAALLALSIKALKRISYVVSCSSCISMQTRLLRVRSSTPLHPSNDVYRALRRCSPRHLSTQIVIVLGVGQIVNFFLPQSQKRQRAPARRRMREPQSPNTPR